MYFWGIIHDERSRSNTTTHLLLTLPRVYWFLDSVLFQSKKWRNSLRNRIVTIRLIITFSFIVFDKRLFLWIYSWRLDVLERLLTVNCFEGVFTLVSKMHNSLLWLNNFKYFMFFKKPWLFGECWKHSFFFLLPGQKWWAKITIITIDQFGLIFVSLHTCPIDTW
jgi:hypothetical protein